MATNNSIPKHSSNTPLAHSSTEPTISSSSTTTNCEKESLTVPPQPDSTLTNAHHRLSLIVYNIMYGSTTFRDNYDSINRILHLISTTMGGPNARPSLWTLSLHTGRNMHRYCHCTYQITLNTLKRYIQSNIWNHQLYDYWDSFQLWTSLHPYHYKLT